MTLHCVFETYIAPLIPLVAVGAVYFLGKHEYFRQKEYELITSRYLDQCIDKISKNVDMSLANFRHNWWQSTVLLKNFRDLGKDVRPELYRNVFIKPDENLFEMRLDYRLRDIIGDENIFNLVNQSLDAFIKTSYAFFQEDLGSMVRVTVEGGNELQVIASREVMVADYEKEIEKLNSESQDYYALLGELQKLSSLIQTERHSFNDFKKLKDKQEIKDSVKALKNIFSSKLSSTKSDDKKP